MKSHSQAFKFTLVATTLLFGGYLDSAIGQIKEQVQPNFESQADRCHRILKDSIYDFYSNQSIDPQNGGYLEVLDEAGKFIPGKEKFLTFQARQLWFFSNMANNKVDRQNAAAAAEHGYGLIQGRFFDSTYGGYFLKVKNDGAPSDNHKHVYPLSFVIYGLVELHRITDSQEVLERAETLFSLIDEKCYDETNGGYNEFFSRDWSPVTDTNQWGVVGPVGFKTYNSHLHLLEAFTQLYLETKDEKVGERLKELVEICTNKVRNDKFGCNVDSWTPDWKMNESEKNQRASYGHDLECAWLVLAAGDALGTRDAKLERWAVKLCDQAIKFGHDKKHGGFFYSGPLGKASDDRKKEWWTQSEALVALLSCYQVTGDAKYFGLFNETLDFVEKHHVAKEGGWYASLKEDASLGDNKSRSSMWQGAYHNGRAMVMCEKMLRRLAEKK